MKKLFAKLSAVALLAALVVVPNSQAASIAVSATSGDANTLELTLGGLTGNIAVSDSFNITVKTLDDGSVVDISGATAVNGTDAAMTPSAFNTTGLNLVAAGVGSTPNKVITITDAGMFPTTEDYVVTLSVIAGTQNVSDFGATTVIKSTQNQVVVTATVEPTLTFVLDTNAVALGTLPIAADTYANDDGATAITPTVSTNAAGGVVVDMTSAGLKTATEEIGVTDIDGLIAQTAAADYYKVSTHATPNITDANDGLANAGGTDMLATQQVYTSAGAAVDGATVRVSVAARAASTTEAGNYTDTLTFSATATF